MPDRSPMPESSESMTFKERVIEFWDWFASQADRCLKTIDDGRCRELQPEFSERMSRLKPEAAWVFGPGANGVGHSFTFTAEGCSELQLLTAYWASHAPELPGWTFYATKQPTPDISGHKIHFNDLVFDPLEFWITPDVDDQDECIDLVVWHPRFSTMHERQRWMATFLYLDEVLGELGTQNWVGNISIEDKRLGDAMPLTELASYVDQVVRANEWEISAPGEMWTSYKREASEDSGMRNDIIAGTTCLFPLVRNVEDGHVDPDPIEGTGADLVYVAMPTADLPKGSEVAKRGEYEDALCAALEENGSGKILGGAIGLEYTYIDLLLFDGKTSLDLVVKTLRAQGLGPGTSIEFFALSRAGERIKLGR